MHLNPESSSRRDWLSALQHEARSLIAELDEHPIAQRLFEGRLDAERYAHYLVQTYHYVRWTTPLLKESGERMKRSGRQLELGELLLQKAREERGHEQWLLKDLGRLGWSAERVKQTEPCLAVAAYVAWNRYTSSQGLPLAFLGTAYVLESLSVQRAQPSVERLLEARSIPNIRQAVTFLRGHGTVDGDHVAELESVLRSLTHEEDHAALLMSARTTRVLYPGLFG